MPVCAWCKEHEVVPPTVYCGRRCRQAAFRLRRRRTTIADHAKPMRFAYADPPYPGLSAKYYRDEPSFAGEVDHVELVARLLREYPHGWALSTSAKALRDILPLCPRSVHVCPWVKPIGIPKATLGLHYTWEALVVVGGRQRAPGVRDWLRAQPARGGGSLPGRKPIAFCAFLFDALGMVPGDELVDLYPGTGIVGRAWEAASRSLERSATPRRSSTRATSGEAVVTRQPIPEPLPCHPQLTLGAQFFPGLQPDAAK